MLGSLFQNYLCHLLILGHMLLLVSKSSIRFWMLLIRSLYIKLVRRFEGSHFVRLLVEMKLCFSLRMLVSLFLQKVNLNREVPVFFHQGNQSLILECQTTIVSSSPKTPLKYLIHLIVKNSFQYKVLILSGAKD